MASIVQTQAFRSLDALPTFEEKITQTGVRYVLFFGGMLAFYSFLNVIFSIGFFESNWWQFALPVGIVYVGCVVAITRRREWLIPITMVLILNTHVNFVATIANGGHWGNIVWIIGGLTLLLQHFMLRDDAYDRVRLLLFVALLVEFTTVALLQETVFGISPPALPDGTVEATAPINIAFFIFFFIILEIGYNIDNNLSTQLTESLRQRNEEVNAANQRVLEINQQLQQQKEAFLAIFEAQARSEVYIAAYLRDLEHETGNSLNPILSTMDMIQAISDGSDYENVTDDIDRLLNIGVPRLKFASQYISDARLHLSGAIGYVTDAANAALNTRDVGVDESVLVDLNERASRIGGSLYAEVTTFHRQELLDRLTVVKNGRIRSNDNLDAILEIAPSLDGEQTYPLALRTIATNLFVNAIKYSNPRPPGEPEKLVRLRITRDDNRVLLTVADEGNGIPDDVLPHIFEFGTRADEHRTSQYGGGVGMWLVKNIVDNVGGTIDIQTSPAGTTVSVYLPIAKTS